MIDKAWVHLSRVDPSYETGASKFVRDVASALGVIDMIVCPCIDCRNIDRHSGSVVLDHLVTRGMEEGYKMRADWYLHGELNSGVAGESRASEWNDEIFGLYRVAECFDEELADTGDLSEKAEGDDKKEDEFLAKLADAETPLYPSCVNHSKLSAIVSLFRLKTHNGWSEKSFNDLLETLSEMLPEENVLHSSLYDVKKFLKSFDMGYEKIHACVNDCCLFRKRFKKLEKCPKCKASRWKTNIHTGEKKKGVPQKVLRYFPIIPRLKRMFRSEKTAKDLRWHFSNKSSDGKLRHPVDSVTWDQMNAKYPTFAAEERNLRLGLSTDGFNPFNMKNSIYSCWPVLVVNYNLPPDLCMKKENIMLSLLIPDPQQPGNSIDVYLEPLIDDLNSLWSIGEITYDALTRSTFTLRAMLLWTISDFPAYGNLAGCKVKGKMGCPLCGKNTDSMWLKFSKKHVYMCHRKGLPPTHSFWGKKKWFDGKAEQGRRGRILTGRDISLHLRNFKNDFGNFKGSASKRKRIQCSVNLGSDNEGLSSESEEEEDEEIQVDEDELSRWKKRSIFFKLPYWEELPVRHNLDVMHVERNVAASLVSTLLHCEKSKDGLAARKDLEELGVSLEDCKLTGLKSHDYHVLMQQLLPIALKGLLPKGPRLAVFRFFPPSFFDIMLHLTVHLGREARLGGPVHFRWMYPFERYMKVLKDFVRNPARPEGCIAESYLAEECIRFCNEFLKKTTNVQEKVDRNMEYDNNSILEGRLISTVNISNICKTQMEDACEMPQLYGVPLDSTEHDETLKWIAYGLRCSARSYTGFIVNGLRFHTTLVDRKSQNSGVYYEATAVCRSSATDTSQVVDLVSYYGRVTGIILVDYNIFYVPLFRCQWAVKGNGVKIEDGFTLVNKNHSQASFASDPYILASQAKQIFYSREDESSNWYIVMKGPSRRYSKEDIQEGTADIGLLPSNIDMDADIDEAENARTDCEGIYG
ncbi:uncharacterized protein LOC106398827 [Brassica napus]|uniref:uncharacterized protein LOC106398827 n=1 Tax=Brassica napus TaxID=3708 RepID=UPI0020790AFC|nr:uncharacterized protein LOC106398827 [Brassica napus]